MKTKILNLMKQKQKEGKKVLLSPDHALPITRRDFIATGLKDSAILVAMPTIFDLLFAKTVIGAPISPQMIFMCIDSAGGAGHQQRDFLPKTESGALPGSAALQRMGLATGDQSTTKFGAPMLMAGRFISNLTVAPPTGGALFAPAVNSATQSKIKFASFSAITRDDSPQGFQSPMALISAYLALKNRESFLVESGVTVGGGSAQFGTRSGGVDPKLRADGWLVVNSATAIKNAISGPYAFLTGDLAVKALTSARNLAQNRRNRLRARSIDLTLSEAQTAGLNANLSNAELAGSFQLNPRDAFGSGQGGLHPSTLAIFDAANNGLSQAEKDNFMSALLGAVRGVTKPMMTIVLSGGDYHNGAEASETTFVQRKVTLIRAATNECLMRNISLVSSYITDGGMVSSGGTRAFNSDEGRFSRQLVSVASNNMQSYMTPRKAQLGDVDPNTGYAISTLPFADNSKVLSVALFASMLAASGETDWLRMVRRIAPDDVISSLSEQQLIAMNAFA